MKQNKGHVKAINELISDPSVPVKSIIAFSNNCKLKLE
ncbi:hypothetical protein [Fictibacillus nanhaiensis]